MKAGPKALEPRIYLHFLDLYHYARAVSGGRVGQPQLVLEARRAFRLAALNAQALYLPASSYFEGELAQLVLGEHTELAALGVVYLAASQVSLEEHREDKLPQYKEGLLAGAYTAAPMIDAPSYVQKSGSSRQLITDSWLTVLAQGSAAKVLANQGDERSARALERVWSDVPEHLGDLAFVTEHVCALLQRRQIAVQPLLVSSILERAYISGYCSSLDAKIVGNLVYLASPYDLTSLAAFSFSRMLQQFVALNLSPLLDRASVNDVVRLRESSEWQELRSLLLEQGALTETHSELAESAAKVAAGSHKFPTMGHMDAEIGVITALPEEFVAMREMLGGSRNELKVPNDVNRYIVGTIDALRDARRVASHNIALTQLRRAGTESASVAAANLLRSFPNVRLVVMVGIACGVPRPDNAAKHVRLGDIVVADRQGAVATTSGAQTEDGFSPRDLLAPPSAAMTDALNILESDALQFGQRPWEALIDAVIDRNRAFRRPAPNTDVLHDAEGVVVRQPRNNERRRGRPLVFRGAIGSSNILSRDPTYRDEVARRHGLFAIEMEGSGIASATWEHGQQYGIIRGSCDYGDSAKGDTWHRYAALVAAAYARTLIERIAPEDLRTIDPGTGV